MRLARDGFGIILHYHRNNEAAQATARLIDRPVRMLRADMSDPEQIEAMFAELGKVRLDVLVVNAGVWKPSPLGATSLKQAREILDTNLLGPFWVMQCALPLLNNCGRVVNISSVAARTSSAGGRSLYGATKAGLESLTRNWAMEVAPRKILVNAVAPGYVTTDMTAAHFSDPATYNHALARHPLGRLGVAEEVADVVAFLCSDDARFITGQTINVSGGFVV